MQIRKKIILYFSATTIILTGIALVFIYTLFSGYREGEFQQRLKDKISFSIKFLDEVQKTNTDLLDNLDQITIDDIYEEKMLLFNADKQLIYASLDNTKIINSISILNRLSPEKKLVKMDENGFDVVGTYIKVNDKVFYGIYKAYDTYGYTQLHFLGYILWAAFFFIAIVTLFVTFYISKQISMPINRMAKEINNIQFDTKSTFISVPETEDEINYLAKKFNELMSRLQNAFAFQKHAIHHISHELKTPITILVSNFEKIELEDLSPNIRTWIKDQKEDTKNLSDIINALLEISKVETGSKSIDEPIRIDDLILDLIEELKLVNNDFEFQMSLIGDFIDEQMLTVSANKRLLLSAFTNLMMNCIQYSNDKKARILIQSEQNNIRIDFINSGETIQDEEQQFMFEHFFRGNNSQGKRGFGLGLVMIHKIILMYNGTIEYEKPDSSTNIFIIRLPLS